LPSGANDVDFVATCAFFTGSHSLVAMQNGSREVNRLHKLSNNGKPLPAKFRGKASLPICGFIVWRNGRTVKNVDTFMDPYFLFELAHCNDLRTNISNITKVGVGITG
jgi:hypothetical protein